MEVEMDLAIDEILCKPLPPSGPRKNSNRRLYSRSLPPLYSKPLPPLPAEVFHIAKELIPAPLFSRRNTLTDEPPLTPVAPAAPAAAPAPAHDHNHSLSPIVLPLPTSPSTVRSPRLSFHSTRSSSTVFLRSSPPSSSHSSNSSPTPFLRSVSSPSSSFYSSFPSATSTPASSPPTSPVPLARSLVCTSCSKICSPVLTLPTEPDPEIIPSRPRMMPPSPKKSLKRKKSPRKDTLRSLRAKESDACLKKSFKRQAAMSLDGLVLEMENLLEGWQEEDEDEDHDSE